VRALEALLAPAVAARATVLAVDLAVLDLLNNQIGQAEQRLATVLPNAPAGVLTIGVVSPTTLPGSPRRSLPTVKGIRIHQPLP